ncbi:GGDEF domain-containing protein [Ideonella sp. DXS22W]|uniref:diguanylate cyclase n=1 Tax=Pseudaquabacterium inlustre TaxID=2984192 RepID=A0ABU9CMI7_9BURK
MDPQTVIFVLALNLMSVGTLLALIGRRMDQAQGMRGYASGTIVFGLAYLLRLGTGHRHTSLMSVLPDTLMVLATLLFVVGLRQFVGLSALRPRAIAAATALYVAVWLVAWWGWQEPGRHVVLNGALAINYLLLAAMAWRGIRRVPGSMSLSLAVLSGVIGLLGVATALRVFLVLTGGIAPLFSGPTAAVYYGYSTFVTVVLGPNLLWMVFLRLNGRLAQLATHDPLTGLLNRHGLDEALRRHFAARPPAPLVLCQFDIDHFKRVNDLHGHATGDAVLRGVADTLTAQVRGSDFVARLGGEEFLVGCVGGAEPALALAERVRAAVARQAHGLAQGGVLHCTLSAGVSPPFSHAQHWEAALRLADEALYRAKSEGRDAVRVARAAPGWEAAAAPSDASAESSADVKPAPPPPPAAPRSAP